MIFRLTKYWAALVLAVVSLQTWVPCLAADPVSKTGNLEKRVYHIEKRLQHVEKRSDQNFRYIDRYDDSFAEVFKRLKRVEETVHAHARSLNALHKRPTAGQVYVPRVERVSRPGGKADMAGVDPADIEALWRQIDAILAALEEMRRGQ